jgi:hypothetical protein
LEYSGVGNTKGKKVYPSLYHVVEAHRVEISRLSHFLDNWLTDYGQAVSLMCEPYLPPGKFLVLVSVRCCADLRVFVQQERSG